VLRGLNLSSELTGERRLHYVRKRRLQRALAAATIIFSAMVLVVFPIIHIELNQSRGLRFVLMVTFAVLIGISAYIISYFKSNDELLIEEMRVREQSSE
jgi:uncharacterized membrane protein (DUF4010 family)